MLSRRFGIFVKILMLIMFVIIACAALAGCDDAKLKDVFAQGDFTITFVLDNGDENVVWRKGDEVPCPQKEGFYFDGWYCDSQRENRFVMDFDNPKLLSNLIVYAKWNALENLSGIVFEDMTVTYDGNPHSILATNIPDGAEITYFTPIEFTDAGEYEISAEICKHGYFDLRISATLTIEKAKIEGIIFESESVEWDGEAHGIYAQGMPDGVTVSYENNGQTETGIYDIIAKFDVGNNYLPIDDMHAQLTIKDKICRVTFVNGDGSSTIVDAVYGEIVENVPKPVDRIGYTAQWSGDCLQTIYEDTTFSAVYSPIEYNIEFVYNDADRDDVLLTYTIESENLAFDEPTRRQYVFGGWFDNATFQGERATALDSGSYGNKKYYAKWDAVEYGISYDLTYDDATNDINNPVSFNAESGIVRLNDPVRINSEFTGWYLVEREELVSEIDPEKYDFSITLQAIWKSVEYSITYVLDGGTNSNENPDKFTVDSVIVLESAKKQYYDFLGWYDALGRKINEISRVACDMTLTARWSPVLFEINYFGIDCAVQNENNPKRFTVESPTLNIFAPSREHYIFDGWYTDADFNGEKVEFIAAGSHFDVCLYAKWSAVVYNISYDVADGDLGDNPTTYTVETQAVALNDPSRMGYLFDGWFIDGERTEILSMGGGDITVCAKWTRIEYKITYDLGDGAQNDDRNPISFYIDGGIIQLYEPARPYYAFAGWIDYETQTTIDCIDCARACDVNVVAVWEEKMYYIEYKLDGGENNSANPARYTVQDCPINLENASKTGYDFVRWYIVVNGEKRAVAQIEASDDFAKDIELCAEFVQKSPFEYEFRNGSYEITAYLGAGGDVNVPSVIDGNKICKLGATVFENAARSITKIEISEGICEIELGAFANMTSLETLVLPSTIQEMPDRLLADCSVLAYLTIPYVGNIKYTVGDENKTLRNFTYLFAQAGVGEIRDGFATVESCSAQINSDGVASASSDGNFAFMPNTLVNVTVLDGDVFDRAFYGCITIESIDFAGKGTTVGSQAMRGCTELKTVSFAESFENFDNYMLYNCGKLERIVVRSAAQQATIQTIKDKKRISDSAVIAIAEM